MSKPQVELTVKYKIYIEMPADIFGSKYIQHYKNAEFDIEEDAFVFMIEQKYDGNFLILPVYKIAK